MDRVYEAAVNRASELEEELKKLNDFIDMYRRTRQMLGLESIVQNENTESTVSSGEGGSAAVPVGQSYPLRPAETPPPSPSGDGQTESRVRRERVTDNPKPADVAKVAIDILKDAGHPMTRRELHGLLKERGLEVRGADPVKTLGTMLWRSKLFDQWEFEGRTGYWPKGIPSVAGHPTENSDLL